jgi:threonyl-tRNA synthetase
MESFVAVLIEHTAGHFPLWLCPDQVAILPVSEKYNEYAQKLLQDYDEQGVRAVLDDRNEKIGRKIRDNELKRIPYMLIVGEKEAEQGLVSVRQQGAEEKGQMTIQEFADFINNTVKEQMSAY